MVHRRKSAVSPIFFYFKLQKQTMQLQGPQVEKPMKHSYKVARNTFKLAECLRKISRITYSYHLTCQTQENHNTVAIGGYLNPTYCLIDLVSKFSSVPMYQCPRVLVSQCSGVPVFWCPVSRCSNVPTQKQSKGSPLDHIFAPPKDRQFLRNRHTWTEVDIELAPS